MIRKLPSQTILCNPGILGKGVGFNHPNIAWKGRVVMFVLNVKFKQGAQLELEAVKGFFLVI